METYTARNAEEIIDGALGGNLTIWQQVVSSGSIKQAAQGIADFNAEQGVTWVDGDGDEIDVAEYVTDKLAAEVVSLIAHEVDTDEYDTDGMDDWVIDGMFEATDTPKTVALAWQEREDAAIEATTD